jgi:hypothetical protein
MKLIEPLYSELSLKTIKKDSFMIFNESLKYIFMKNSFFRSTLIFENFEKFNFYLPHMEYEGSIGLATGKMKIFFCLFSLFRTFL